MKKTAIFVIFSFVLVGFTVPADAWSRKSRARGKRGLINVATAILEIPKQARNYYKDQSSKSGKKNILYVLPGTAKGFTYAVKRVGSGLWDMGTINSETHIDKDPIMKPDFVWEKDSNY